MQKWLLPLLLILLVLADTVYTFVQQYHAPMDGDMANIIWPGQYYQQVLEDPFGLGALLKKEIYAAPNRFFAHWFMSGYFKMVPLWLQTFLSPIDSVYAACALLKTGIHVLILTMLAYFGSSFGSFKKWNFLLALALLFPLFQTAGFSSQLGIVDQAPTYAVFYGLPFGFLLLFLAGFRMLPKSKSIIGKSFLLVGLIILSWMLAFSGPLIPPVILIGLPLLLLFDLRSENPDKNLQNLLFQNPLILIKSIPKLQLFLVVLAMALCVYSLYLGFYNSENPAQAISIWERYGRLPLGLYYLIVRKVGLPLLLLMILVNGIMLHKRKEPNAKMLLTLLQWIGIFAVLYLLLLPLGGYREYRPNIIRKDTFMPVLLPLLLFYSLSSVYLLQHLVWRTKSYYVALLLVFLIVFTISDKPLTNQNACERDGLEKLAKSEEIIVKLDNDCTILEWNKVTDYRIIEAHARLLQFWKITKKKQYYIQK